MDGSPSTLHPTRMQQDQGLHHPNRGPVDFSEEEYRLYTHPKITQVFPRHPGTHRSPMSPTDVTWKIGFAGVIRVTRILYPKL